MPEHKHRRVRFAATLDGWTGILSGFSTGAEWIHWLRHPRLTIQHGSDVWQARPKAAPGAFHYEPIKIRVRGWQPGGYLCLARFRDFDDPMVILGTYSGGAHCCMTYRTFDPDTQHELQLNAGNQPVSMIDTGSAALLRTADDRFSYEFTAFAGSAWPLTILRPTPRGFVDVTRSHPHRVANDARQWWHWFQRAKDGRGLMAAWAADEEMLGRDHHVWTTLNRFHADPRLRGHGEAEYGWPGGSHYIVKLMRFLETHGYRTP